MSILSRRNWVPQQRLDLSDMLALESFNAFDLRAIITSFTGVQKPLVVRGFKAVGKSGLSVSIKVADSLVYNPQDGNGSMYLGKSDDANITVSLPSDQTNIFVEATFEVDSDSPVNIGVWDALSLSGEDASGQEFSTAADFERFIKLSVSVNTVGFTPGSVPLFRASTSASTVTKLTDSRNMLYRLGSGGANPDPQNSFDWSEGRTEPVTEGSGVGDSADSPWRDTDASGSLNDKSFQSFKDWADAIMTRFKEITGSSYWYTSGLTSGPVSGINLNQMFFDTLGHSLEPSKNSAFKWTFSGADLVLTGEGQVEQNVITSQYHDGLIKWKSNHSKLEWQLGGSFVSNVAGGKRNYTDVKFASPSPVDGGNVYLALEREVQKGSGADLKWRDNTQEGSFDATKAISGQLTDFTGVAIGDFIRKDSEGYSRYIRVVKMSDGTNIFDIANDSDQNYIADDTIIAVELEDEILSTSNEPLKYFRNKYSNADLVADVSADNLYQDVDFYWLGRRKEDLFIFRAGWGTLQPGEEVTTLDFSKSEGQRPGEGELRLEHANGARYDTTNGYESELSPALLLTIRKRKSDNTIESPTVGSDNSDSYQEYTIETDPGLLTVGDGLWVRLSDETPGELTAGSVTNTTDDEDNTDVNTNAYEIIAAADSPVRSFDNRNVYLLARRIDVNGQPALLFCDGSVLSTFGTTLNNKVEMTSIVKLTNYDDTAIPYIAQDGSKQLNTTVSNLFYNEATSTFGLFNLRWEGNNLAQEVPEDYNFFNNLGAHTVTVGTADSTVRILGDLIVDGDKIIANVTQFQTEDKLATFNVGGGLDSGFGGGIEIADETRNATSVDSFDTQPYVDINVDTTGSVFNPPSIDVDQNTDNSQVSGLFPNDLYAQTFIPGATGNLTEVRFLGRLGAATLNVEIYETLGGLPTGAPLGTSDVYNVPGGPSLFSNTFIFSFSTPVALVAGTTYAAVITTSSGNYILRIGTGDPYADGQLLVTADGGTSWTAQPTNDAVFETYMSALQEQYSVGERIGVAANEDVGGITAGQISGEYVVVATAAVPGDAEVIDSTTLRVWTTGTATATENEAVTPPKVFKAEWGIRVSDADGNTANAGDVTSFRFETKNSADTRPTLTPVDDYGTVPTAHSVNMLQNRIPFVNPDTQGPAGADSTLNFSPNFLWDNSTDTLIIDGNISVSGGFTPDVDCSRDIGTPSLTWRNLYMCETGSIRFGANNIIQSNANEIEVQSNLEVTDGHKLIVGQEMNFVNQGFSGVDAPTNNNNSAFYTRRTLGTQRTVLVQKLADGSEVILTPTRNKMHEIVEVVNAPSGNNEMAPIVAPSTLITIPEDTRYMLGERFRVSTDGSTDEILVDSINHGLANGDTITIYVDNSFGGLTFAQMSGTFTIFDATTNTFKYNATAVSTSVDSSEVATILTQRRRFYSAGTNDLKVWINGKLAKKGVDYEESGFLGTSSQQVVWNHLLVDGDYVEYEIDPTSDKILQ